MTIWHKIRGALALLGMLINTLLLCLPLYAFALLRLVLRFEKAQVVLSRILVVIAETWIGNNNAIIALTSQIKWRISGMDTLSKDQWYLVTCNHQSWADILVLQRISNRRIPFLKFFLKQELIKVPLLGLAWWALDFPFMKRYTREYLIKHPEKRGEDLKATRRACEKFRYTPVSVMNFVEGTRFTQAKHDKQKSRYTHLLTPKAGGAAFVLDTMGDSIQTLVDVTIAYPGGAPSFWDFICGRVPEVKMEIQTVTIPEHLKGRDYSTDGQHRRNVKNWLAEQWQAKDARLEEMLRR